MDGLIETLIWLVIALAMAVYGSHKITRLTNEVNEARRFGRYRAEEAPWVGRDGGGLSGRTRTPEAPMRHQADST